MKESNGEERTLPQIGLAAGMVKTASAFDPKLLEVCSSVTFGSFTLEARQGNPEPTYYFDEMLQVSINAVGLTNQGLARFLEEDLPKLGPMFVEREGVQLRVSLAPLKRGDLMEMLLMVGRATWRYIDVIEVNAACPNHRDEGGLHPVLAKDPDALADLMEETHGFVGLPLSIKIAPDTNEDVLLQIPDFCERYGFSEIVSGNTRLGSSVMDGTQVLSVEKGGHAGACLLEAGVEQLAMLKHYIDERPIKVVACGGVLDADAISAYRAFGADELQVATGYMQYGPKFFRDLYVSYLED